MELKSSEIKSVLYHNIFDYPLKEEELFKWKCFADFKTNKKVVIKNGFYLVEGHNESIHRRKERERYSKFKMKAALKAAKVLEKVPFIKFVGITGALAMMNAGKKSDIDLMVVTKANSLWSSRILTYILLKLSGIKLRTPKQRNEKDKLCINLWLDENDLVWSNKDRNLYTAHEIAQVVPVINKDNTYQKFIYKNKWILKFWPRSYSFKNTKFESANPSNNRSLIEIFAYKFQYLYMKSKITREKITHTRAIFHPRDWGKEILNKLAS